VGVVPHGVFNLRGFGERKSLPRGMSSPGRVFVLEVNERAGRAGPMGGGKPSATRAAQYSPWNLAAGDRCPEKK